MFSQGLSFLSGSDPQLLPGDAPWISTVTLIIAASFLSVASSLRHRSARPRTHAEGFWQEKYRLPRVEASPKSGIRGVEIPQVKVSGVAWRYLLSLLEQVQFPGSHQSLGAAVGIELAVDAADVGLDRARGDEQFLGDPAV